MSLLPGLNDIADVFEAVPLDLVRYFTVLKEIDAKALTTAHRIPRLVERLLALAKDDPQRGVLLGRLNLHIRELLPCLEEKMHVALVALDVMLKHLRRMNDDYEMVLANEIPESVRIGPLHHPAMVDLDNHKGEKTAQTQRLELRREALAARKAAALTGEKKDKAAKKKPDATPRPPSVPSEPRPATPGAAASAPAKKPRGKKRSREPEERAAPGSERGDNGEEPVYCYCQQVLFGQMMACDGDQCSREWFHLQCLGFDSPPKGKWYCDDCMPKKPTVRREFKQEG